MINFSPQNCADDLDSDKSHLENILNEGGEMKCYFQV